MKTQTSEAASISKRIASRRPRILLPGTEVLFTRAMGRVWGLGAAFGLYAWLVYALRADLDLDPGLPLEALITFSAGLMLSVRVSKAYERWWEARTQWGKLVNVSRNLALKIETFARPSAVERAEIHGLIQGFAHALKNHLRGSAVLGAVPGFEQERTTVEHLPSHLASRLYRVCDRLRADARLDSTQLLILDAELRELLEVCGACERIKNTLMPLSFVSFVRSALVLLLLSLPWELTESIQVLTIPAQVLATYLLIGGESIAYHFERPFGLTHDCLDLEGYCAGIDQVVGELLGRAPVGELRSAQ